MGTQPLINDDWSLLESKSMLRSSGKKKCKTCAVTFGRKLHIFVLDILPDISGVLLIYLIGGYYHRDFTVSSDSFHFYARSG